MTSPDLRETAARAIDPLAWEVSDADLAMAPKGMSRDEAQERALSKKSARRAQAFSYADAVLLAIEPLIRAEERRKALEEVIQITGRRWGELREPEDEEFKKGFVGPKSGARSEAAQLTLAIRALQEKET